MMYVKDEVQDMRPLFPIEIVRRDDAEHYSSEEQLKLQREGELYDKLAWLGPS